MRSQKLGVSFARQVDLDDWSIFSGITSKLSERPLKLADQKTERGKVINPEYSIFRDQPIAGASPLRINTLLSCRLRNRSFSNRYFTIESIFRSGSNRLSTNSDICSVQVSIDSEQREKVSRITPSTLRGSIAAEGLKVKKPFRYDGWALNLLCVVETIHVCWYQIQ